MVTILKKRTAKIKIQSLSEKLANNSQNRGIDTHKFCGKLKLKKDSILIQKKLRNG